ncbi:DUF4097 family beta strand repeat-containing protein [Spirosoma sp.]|uniref:DUF4097 family beta strand repeat-containing protein n=1 Tax=Spirosoma sp. TaxID=1899569 RepID=UPI003B3AC132
MKPVLLSFLLWLPLLGRSQTPIQVVTKVIEKTLPYADGQLIQLNAQKADVILKGWNQATVSVKLRLIAKHPDRAVAEREVTYHQYVFQNENGHIALANRFVIPQRAGKLQSQLKAVYEINVPTKAPIALTNAFGDMHLTDLAGDVNLTFEFGKLSMESLSGKVSVTSSYGDIDGRNLHTTLTVKAEKADVVLRDLGGTVTIQSRYGTLNTLPATSLNELIIDATRTDVAVSLKRLLDFRFDVAATSAEIYVPEELSDLISKRGNKQSFRYLPNGRKSEIRIQNSYGKTSIQNDKSVITTNQKRP